MAVNEMLFIKKGYDFSKWLLQHTGKFPKSYRFSVAAKPVEFMFLCRSMKCIASKRDVTPQPMMPSWIRTEH